MIKNENKLEFQAEIVSRLATLDALLAGFSFAGLTLATTGFQDCRLRIAVFVTMSVTTIIFIVVSVIGALLGMVVKWVSFDKDALLNRIYLIFLLGSYLGIISILTSVSLLAYTMNIAVGLVVILLSVIGFILCVLSLYWIGTLSSRS